MNIQPIALHVKSDVYASYIQVRCIYSLLPYTSVYEASDVYTAYCLISQIRRIRLIYTTQMYTQSTALYKCT